MKFFSRSSLYGGIAFVVLVGIASSIIEMKPITTRGSLSSLLAIGSYVTALVGAYFVQKKPAGKKLAAFGLFLVVAIVLAGGSLFI